MFQLDDQFLISIGLENLPEEQRKPFLQHIYDQLEYRVGIKLSEGMSDDQLEEFEAIIDRKQEVVLGWIQTNAPGYATDELFAKIKHDAEEVLAQEGKPGVLSPDDPALLAEYAATKWLEVNRPDYRDVVAATLEGLKQEISQNRDAILGSAPAAPAAQ